MTAVGVSGRNDNYHSLADCFFGGLVNDALRTRNVVISTQRYVQYADVVTLAIGNYPANTFRDLFFSNAAAFTDFHQHEFRFMVQSAVDTVTEVSITSGLARSEE